MNEQQMADLFSEQLDRMLQGQEAVLPADANGLQELLGFSRQLAQINFQTNLAAEAAFHNQLAAWFGPKTGGSATILGPPKVLLFILGAGAVTIGLGLALLIGPFLDIPGSNSKEPLVPEPTEFSTTTPLKTPGEPQATAAPVSIPTKTTSSLEDSLPAGNSSLEDTLPSSPSSLGETLSLPPPEPATTAEDDVGPGTDPNQSAGDDEDSSSGDTDGDNSQAGDHDRGHGNDADGFDEDNPGNSTGLPDNKDGNQGQGNNPNGPNVGDFSRGNGGGRSDQGGGQGSAGGGNGQGKGKGGGNSQGQGNEK